MAPKMQMPTTMTAKMSWKMRRTRKFRGSSTIWGSLTAMVASQLVPGEST
jgi:hypothetical protein